MEEFDNWEPPLYDGSANILSVSLLLVLSLFVLAWMWKNKKIKLLGDKTTLLIKFYLKNKILLDI